jgi:EcsC protein family
MSKLSAEELNFLEEAARFLENPGIFIRVANRLGQPVEYLEKKLPQKARDLVATATQKSLEKALRVAVGTIPQESTAMSFRDSQSSITLKNRLHTLGTAITGGIGGFFGVASLPVELPITTAIMLRSIAEVARSSGADLSLAETQLECLYVFTLGSPSKDDDAAETAYYASRLGLAKMISQAASFIAKHSAAQVFTAIEKGTAPVLVKLIATIASKFEIAVSEKLLSEAIPVIGAAGGAMVNSAFTHYFSEAARFHFGIRKLERTYGASEVQRLYEAMKRSG